MDRESSLRGLPLTQRLRRMRDILDALHGGVLREEERYGLQMSRPLPVDFHGVALAWADGQELATIAGRARMQEGDVVGALQKTLDLISQLRGAAQQGPLGARLIPLLDEADGLLRRGVVEASYRWAVSGPPEGGDEDEDEDDDSWSIYVPDEENAPTNVRHMRQRRPPPFVKRPQTAAARRPAARSARRKRSY
jgi:hypothetical protein